MATFATDGIDLGDQCRDQVTGIAGTVTGVCFGLFAPPRICVEYVDQQGRPQIEWFDEQRIRVGS